MLKYLPKSSASLAILATLQSGLISNANAQQYEEFAAVMSKFGYAWTYEEVTTEDDWILTLFRITGKEDQDPVVSTHPPILLQHGSTMDAESWINSYFAGIPMPL